MAKPRTYYEKVMGLEKRIKELEAENAELKIQLAKLQSKKAHYKGSPMKEHYSTVEIKSKKNVITKKDAKEVIENAVSEVHEEDKK